MQVTLDLPDPKFSPGDVILVRNKLNEKQRYYWVSSSGCEGNWYCSLVFHVKPNKPFVCIHRSNYLVIVQPDSWAENETPSQIMPGTWLSCDMDELEHDGELIEGYDKSIVPGVTTENAIEKRREWETSCQN